MSDNVASLWGAAPPIPHQVPSVIDKLERLLERAKDGNVVGLAWVSVDPFGGIEYGRMGAAEADRMIAGASRLWHDMLQDEFEARRD